MNTAMPANAARLAALRDSIDRVDAELLRMLNQRAALSLEVGKVKQRDADSIFKPQREREVLDALLAHNAHCGGYLRDEHIHSIWDAIFSASRALQMPQKVEPLGSGDSV